MKPRVIIACHLPGAVIEQARAQFDAVIAETADMTIEEAFAAAERHTAEGIVITSSQKLDVDAITRLPQSVRIAATSSVGFDHIDVPAARARGLIVTNTPDVLTDCTADMAMLLMLGACRRATEYAQIMRDGWRRRYDLSEMLGMHVVCP